MAIQNRLHARILLRAILFRLSSKRYNQAELVCNSPFVSSLGEEEQAAERTNQRQRLIRTFFFFTLQKKAGVESEAASKSDVNVG